MGAAAETYFDLPNTASSQGYTICIANTDNATSVQFPQSTVSQGTAVMTLEEIQGALPDIIPDNDNDPRLLNVVG